MVLGKVETTIIHTGGASFSFGNADVNGILGQAESGTANQLYDRSNFGDAQTLLASGKLLDLFYDFKACGGGRAKLCRIEQDVAGTTGDVVKEEADTPGSATAAAGSGEPKTTRDYVLEIVNGGDMADPTDVTYKLSEDGGTTWGPIQAFPAGASPVTLTLPNGAQIVFTEGVDEDFKEGDKFHVSTVGPGYSTANLLAALEVMKYDGDVRVIVISDETTPAEAASLSVIANWMKDENRPTMWIIEGQSFEDYFDENYACVKTGTGPDAPTLDGTPQNRKVIVIKITVGGDLGTAKYKMSEDGGVSYGTEQTLPVGGLVYIPNGILATFAAGIYVVDDIYTFGNTVDDWVTAVSVDYDAFYNWRFACVFWGFKVGDYDGVPRDRLATGCMAGVFSRIALSKSCGNVNWGTIPHAVDTFPGEADGVKNGDVSRQDTFDDHRLVTTRFWDGYGFVVSKGVTLAPINSVLKRFERGRVINELDRANHTTAVQLVEYDYIAGEDDAVIQKLLERPAKAAKDRGDIADYTLEFDPEQDVEATGYFKAIETIYFKQTIPGVWLDIVAAVGGAD
jgi:hypothetical protein